MKSVPQQRRIRTRFAPSPTGFMHLGNLRSALYPWVFARAHHGDFILRIEDTDQERSTQAAVDVILDSLAWLGLDYDEGPIYQTQRLKRYREVLEQLRSKNWVYPCYMSSVELDELREKQMAAKQKPRYDGTWRPEPGKVLPAVPVGVEPVWRFRTPLSGSVTWNDRVKGLVTVTNEELDDLVIARSDGLPTYNFCAVVDDIDMAITHVIRGDDHVNNTPRQIHLFKALGHEPPVYAHLPTVLNAQGEKMSKRHGAKAVTVYRDEGFLPAALINYLARLGWSHGDDELFSLTQLISWFNLDHLGKSAAQFDEAKLRWVNAQHIKALSPEALMQAVHPYLLQRYGESLIHSCTEAQIAAWCALYKDRCDTLVHLAEELGPYLGVIPSDSPVLEVETLETLGPVVESLIQGLSRCDWEGPAIAAVLKDVLAHAHLKMPQLAIPLRICLLGRTTSPSLDAVLALFDRQYVLKRLQQVWKLSSITELNN
jgi:glutamyl-tRNA synthetase